MTALRPQDLVLTMFGSYVRGPEPVWSGGIVRLLEGFGVTTAAGRAALSRLAHREVLIRARRGRRTFYSLSPSSQELMAEGDRRIFSFARDQAPGSPWTVVWHTVPEQRRVERGRLASRLRFLGFTTIHDGTWVAAHDREQEVLTLVRDLDLESYTSIVVGHMAGDLARSGVVERTWRLDDVRQRYEAFLSDFGGLRLTRRRWQLSGVEAFRARTMLLHRFRGFPSVDPEPPAAVDPLHDLRAEVSVTFDDVYRGLEQPASEYFWSVAGVQAAGVGSRDAA